MPFVTRGHYANVLFFSAWRGLLPGRHMRRREFITVLGSAAAWPRILGAQGNDRSPRIGVLMDFAANDPQAQSNVAALQRGLHKLGWKPGGNLGIDYRWAPGDAVLTWKFAKELVELRPDVIVARSSPVVTTLLGETRNIPIVFVSISDPVGEGFVASFAHPGGNVTGFTNFESSMTGKWVELLKDIAPEITRVGFLFNPQTTAGGGSYFLRPIDAAASAFKVKAAMALVHDEAEIEAAFADLASEPGAGAVLLPDIFTADQRVIFLAERYRVPTVYGYRFMAEEGGLISYGVDLDNLFERAAGYVDRILQGANPADLPVQAPIKFELVINRRTAGALGLAPPATLLAISDEVIE
ncbi:MAG: ABC transporter substrate-binding protein [Xanthobacteraceae bacterium]